MAPVVGKKDESEPPCGNGLLRAMTVWPQRVPWQWPHPAEHRQWCTAGSAADAECCGRTVNGATEEPWNGLRGELLITHVAVMHGSFGHQRLSVDSSHQAESAMPTGTDHQRAGDVEIVIKLQRQMDRGQHLQVRWLQVDRAFVTIILMGRQRVPKW